MASPQTGVAMHEPAQQPDADCPQQVEREDRLKELDHSGDHDSNTRKHQRQ
mgnify:CR=1 FL=1